MMNEFNEIVGSYWLQSKKMDELKRAMFGLKARYEKAARNSKL